MSGFNDSLRPTLLHNEERAWYTRIMEFFHFLFQVYVLGVIEKLTGRHLVIGKRKLRFVRLIAEGGYGYVYLVENQATKEKFALKQINLLTSSHTVDFRTEVSAHMAVNHVNVMPLIDKDIVLETSGNRTTEVAYMLFPYMEKGTLQRRIDSFRERNEAMNVGRIKNSAIYFSEQETIDYGLGITAGLQALHAANLSHRDLCPRNVMVDHYGLPVITDLGSVERLITNLVTRSDCNKIVEAAEAKSSMPYRAPELWSCDPGDVISGAVDVWSLGCTLYCLAFGLSPFESTLAADGTLRICDPSHSRVLGPLVFPRSHSFSQEFCALITDMLQLEPARRPTLQQVFDRLSHIKASLSRSWVHGSAMDAQRNTTGTVSASVPSGSTGVAVMPTPQLVANPENTFDFQVDWSAAGNV